MSEATAAAIADLLGRCNVMSLATWEEEAVWAASVFFASDEALQLYFVSSASSRHGRNLAANPNVAVTVNKDHDDWFDIRGLQIEGRAALVAGAERGAALDLYLRKFQRIARLRDAPVDAQERLIGDRLLASDFFVVRPRRIRLIDNTRGFGFKQELSLVGDAPPPRFGPDRG